MLAVFVAYAGSQLESTLSAACTEGLAPNSMAAADQISNAY